MAEVLAVERRRLRALVERDLETADRLHSPDYQLITPAGRCYGKGEYLADVREKRLEYLAFEPASPITARVSAGMIVLRYVALIRLSVGVADELEFRAWHTDHYEKVDGSWVAVWSQATRISDPPTGRPIIESGPPRTGAPPRNAQPRPDQ